MPQTILQMVQNAENELGLPQSASVFGGSGTTDATGTQMGALANRVLDEMRRMNRWTVLQQEYDIVVNVATVTTGNMVANSPIVTNIASGTAALTAQDWQVIGAGIPVAARIKSVDSSSQVTMTMENANTTNLTNTAITFAQDTYPLPLGIDWFNNRTFWDRTNRWELIGPDSPQIDQWHRSGIVATGPRRHYRILPGINTSTGATQDMIRIWPSPVEIANPLQLVFEYLSEFAVAKSGGTTYAQYFTTDTDTCLLDENAITMGIKWMFWEVKGFGAYVPLQGRWVDYVDRLISRDGPAPTLKLVKRGDPLLISPNSVQDGFFPPGVNTQ
jgi:hypothetical protein